jgi:hypothetical protein
MQNSFRKPYTSLIVLLCLASSAKPQGFVGPMGIGPAKTVIIKELLPAAVNLTGKRIKIEATSAIKSKTELIQILETKLRTKIQGDPRYIVDERNPQTILRFTITNAYVDAKTYTVGSGTNATSCTGYVGKLEVSYQALDAANHAPFDSENLVAALTDADKSSGGNSLEKGLREIPKVLPWHPKGACTNGSKASLHEADDYLIDGIVEQMAKHAAPIEENITVRLPGKKLEKLSELAIRHRWADLEEEASKTPELKKEDGDAYRIYLIGLAQEAQAYEIANEAHLSETGKRKDIKQSEAEADFEKSQRLLDKARANYKKALDSKPKEREFLDADTRMEKAITIYATIERHKDEYHKFSPAPEPAPEAKLAPLNENKPVVGVAPVAGSPIDQILKYCQANMDLETITDYIKDPAFLQDAKSSNYRFDFKTDPLALNAACKDKATTIQKLMRDRLSGQRTSSAGK